MTLIFDLYYSYLLHDKSSLQITTEIRLPELALEEIFVGFYLILYYLIEIMTAGAPIT